MDFHAVKRWIYLAVAVSVSVVSCWGSARVTQAEDDRRRAEAHLLARMDLGRAGDVVHAAARNDDVQTTPR